MTVKELIDLLQKQNPDDIVTISPEGGMFNDPIEVFSYTDNLVVIFANQRD